ncbi:MAG TPA: polysaccharide deacetylase family protein [Elusimicrobiales bacterium]|nr:polysaccharide deacetylase family protein [Elusimicrobiales bacterium]
MIYLKVDIDTFRGTEKGVPNLLRLFAEENVSASFFATLGADESGKALKRIFKKGFIKKMFRTNAVKLYGIKTMLYGTLLPAPIISKKLAETLKKIELEGHELGIHSWNHVKWQDNLDSMTENQIDLELNKALSSYSALTGHKPYGFAAPAWKINETALKSLLKCDFRYLSVARGQKPAYIKIGDIVSDIIEIPTTMPTLDEILAWDNMTPEKALQYLTDTPKKNNLNVFTLHSEVEGMAYLDFFKNLIVNWKKKGFSFKLLHQVSEDLKNNPQKYAVTENPVEITFKNFLGRAQKLASV